ncbi:hypothetical protein ACQCVH_04970 [Bacillus infantis]|uniref:hypothetical protein n=1 Tax=Bacillus infantis TaxID=324767 RepID=UPI003CEAC341
MKKRVLIITIVSLAFTFVSPFIFDARLEVKPDSLTQNLLFGGPFPFAEQTSYLPEQVDAYPVVIQFESPLEKETNYKLTPLVLTELSYFLLFFAVTTIITRLFKGNERR